MSRLKIQKKRYPRVRVHVEPPPRLTERINIRNPLPPMPSLCPVISENDVRAQIAYAALCMFVKSVGDRDQVYDAAWYKLFELAVIRYPEYEPSNHWAWFKFCLANRSRDIRDIHESEDPTDVILWQDNSSVGKFRMSYSTSHELHLYTMRTWLIGYLMLKHPNRNQWIFHPA
jgi:hypothetical protein